jgi:hypothetical protein
MIPTSRLMPGNHPAVVLDARMTRNHNGKLNVELDLKIGNRRLQHNLYCTSEAGTANTAKQLKNAFGVTSFKDVGKIAGQQCSVRIEEEEYNGKVSPKIRYVNPHSTSEATDVDLDALDAGFAAKSNIDECAF